MAGSGPVRSGQAYVELSMRDKFSQSEFGINYWLTDGVVFKMDYRDRDHTLVDEKGRDFSAIDLGFGYAF